MNKLKMSFSDVLVSILAILSFSFVPKIVTAAELEEIIVTARKVEESLQDVPVTVSALSAKTIEQYGIDDSAELANMVPNLIVAKGSSGGNASIRLRGIGSSAISAAFDSAVAFNVDGIQLNSARFMHQGFFDMEQIELLKGPQSLYFGKSASAGVLTLNSKNPGDEFEAGLTGSYEFEEEGIKFDAFVSGPLTETLGARLAVRWTEVDEIVKNNAGPGLIGGLAAAPPFLGPQASGPTNTSLGEESIDVRLTLDWQPTDDFHANLKVLHSEYENDGPNMMTDILCTNATPQDTFLAFVPGLTFPVDLDCDPLDGVIQQGDLPDIEASGAESIPGAPFNNGVPYFESNVTFISLNLGYDINEYLSLTSITGWVDMEGPSLTGSGLTNINTPWGHAQNERENFSQELRLDGQFGDNIDFTIGGYYQNRTILFDTYQGVESVSVVLGLDPATGNSSTYRKVHDTEADAWSAFVSVSYRPIEMVEITAGARYSNEEHDGTISVPYVHGIAALTPFPLIGAGFERTGINFEDNELSPEVSVTWSVRDNINLYAAYKTGFKSGGIDNSLLAVFSIATADPTFHSETVEGFELGMKSDLLDNSLRLNITGYFYTFEDLQTQEFDQTAFNFVTLNAGEVETKGVEMESLWITPVEGLTMNMSWAYSDAEYTKDFFVTGDNPAGTLENLHGAQIQGNAKWSGNFGFDYERPVSLASKPFVFNLGTNASYRSDYIAGVFSNSFRQDDYVKVNARAGLATEDGKWELSLIGQNLNDKRTATNVVANRTRATRDPVTGFGDQIVQFSHGRTLTLQGRWRY